MTGAAARSRAPTHARSGHLVGTRTLLAVALRQDARRIAPWVVLISALSASSILAYSIVFPDPQDRAELATTLGANPALSLIFGPARDLSTADGFNAWRAGALGAFFSGLMTVLVVVRNSRADEDSGQAELVASGVIARESRLAVAVAMAAIASVALGVVCFLLTLAVGGGALPTLVLASTFTASGWMFAGLAAVTAQVGSDARTAATLAVGALGVCFVMRGYIDAGDYPEWATWLTPLGWLQETRPASENDPWPLLAALGLALALVLAAFALQARRDFGQGLVAPRPGPADAGMVGGVWGLALRLHGAALVTWLVSFAGLGVLLGNLVTSLGDVLAGNAAMADVLASGVVDPADLSFAFLATILQIIAVVAAVAGVQVVMRVHAEETDLRLEPLLSASLRRRTYLASNAVVALAATAAAMLVAGTTLGLVASAAEDSISFGDVLAQAAVTVPAVWVLVALALAAVGAAPALRAAGWLGVVVTFGLTILGPTLDLPQRVLDVSPLAHVPRVTEAAPDWAGLAGLGAVAIVLLVAGFVGFRRRDVG